jgi:hypothetical protein
MQQPVVHIGQPQVIMAAPQIYMPPVQVRVGMPQVNFVDGTTTNINTGVQMAPQIPVGESVPATSPPAAGQTTLAMGTDGTLPLVMRTPIQVKSHASTRYIPGYAGH